MAAFTNMKPFYAGMTTVVSFDISGIDIRDSVGDDSAAVKELIRKHVEPRVKEIVDQCKASSRKFEDPDFGPTEKDPLGAVSLYGSALPAPAGSKYPKPEDLRWDRPQYDDKGLFSRGESVESADQVVDPDADADEDDEDMCEDDEEGGVWCKHGALFQCGSGANDVIQGQLGDCWFLGALAVMGTKETLLSRCFWQGEKFREFGIFICRFYKDTSMMYVIIDDRIPVKQKDGKVIFASCKDPNELWVPLIEKAYAKLHGCYKALIGGYSHYALADMTGYCPRLIVMKPGFPGFSDPLSKDDVWAMLERYQKWECLLGTSIQSNPKENHKVEAEAGMGLHMGHAYSFLGLGTITDAGKETKLVRLRNPWGRGEWEGKYSDRSDEMDRTEIQDELTKYKKQFNIAEPADDEEELGNFNDGAFFMPFDDWYDRFTSLFVAINFPDGTQEALLGTEKWTGKRAKGTWSGEAGGNREMTSWLSNPKLRFKLKPSNPGQTFVDIFVGLYIKDSRLTMGFDYYKDPLYATPLAFDIVTKDFVDNFDKPLGKDARIQNADPTVDAKGNSSQPKQAPYNFGTTQVEIRLKTDTEYFIVPSLYKRSLPGEYCLTVYAGCDFDLEGANKLSGDSQPMIKTKRAGECDTMNGGEAKAPPSVTLDMSKTQYFEKMESLRERLVAEAKTLGVNLNSMKSVFIDPGHELTYSEFKKALMGLGFNLIDLSDNDLQVLDSDDSKTISPAEFIAFFEVGLNMEEQVKGSIPPPPPVDDLAFKATDMEGVLTVSVSEAHALRETKAWFSRIKDGESTVVSPESTTTSLTYARKFIRYDNGHRDKALERSKRIFSSRSATSELAKKELHEARNPTATTDMSSVELYQHKPDSMMLTQDLVAELSSPRFKSSRSGGISKLDEDQKTYRSARYQSDGANEAASKLHADPELQKAEIKRTENLAKLRRQQQSNATNARTAEIEEAGALRKKVRMAEKLERRNICSNPQAMALLGIRAIEVLLDKPWYKPHKSNVTPMKGQKATPAISQIKLPSGCKLTTPSALFFVRRTGKCPVTSKMVGTPEPAALKPTVEPTLSTPGQAAIDAAEQIDTNLQSSQSTEPVSEATASAGDTLSVTAEARTPSKPPSVPSEIKFSVELTNGSIKEVTFKPQSVDANGRVDESDLVLIAADGTGAVVYDHKKWLKERESTVHNLQIAGSALFEDIFDIIIDRVSIIVESQSKSGRVSDMNMQMKRLGSKYANRTTTEVTRDSFNVFSRVVSALPSPSITSKAKPGPVKLGTASRIKTPGSASVRKVKSAAQSEAELKDAAAALLPMQKDKSERFVEVYRRLSMISTVYLSELDGDRTLPTEVSREAKGQVGQLGSFARHLFERFDLNMDGTISLDEFKQALRSMNIDISEEDAVTMFNRFERTVDGMIDWAEFSDFFKRHIASDHSSGVDGVVYRSMRPMRKLLAQLQPVLHDVFNRMTLGRHKNVEAYLLEIHGGSQVKPQEPSEETFVLPVNAILLRLEASNIAANVHILKLLGVYVSVEEMMRLNFVFKNDLKLIMEFAAAEKFEINGALAKMLELVIRNLSTRAGDDKKADANGRKGREMTNENVLRLWSLISSFVSSKNSEKAATGGTRATVRIDELANFFVSILGSEDSKISSIDGVHVDTLCRVVVDGIVATPWNRASAGHVSYSAFEAFIREGHVNSIERKMRYLLELEMSLAGPTTYALVHVYVNESKTESVVLVHEPLVGTVYKLVVKEDLSALPMDESLDSLFPWKEDLMSSLSRSLEQGDERQVILDSKKYLSDASFTLYNPFDTPEEDAAISDLVSRLRIVKGSNSSKLEPEKCLVVAEDPRFVAQLKKLLDSVASLPFFCNCNETSLFFDVDKDTLEKNGNIRQLVFGSIRKQKSLHSFLVSVVSELRVVLSSYNSGVKVSMPWCEMLAHLTEYRNPYVTVELKPKFLHPHQYMYRPEDSSGAFTGNEEEDPLALQQSAVVMDGGSHPSFNATFKIKFQPPKLTSCKLLSTEIHKMDIDGELKYVILMVREARRDCRTDPDMQYKVGGKDEVKYHNMMPPEDQTFRFITIYDPRTATDYQCGVKHGCKLYEELLPAPGDGGVDEATLDKLQAQFKEFGKIVPDPIIAKVMGKSQSQNVENSLAYEQLLHALTRDKIHELSNGAQATICNHMGAGKFDEIKGSMSFVQFLRVCGKVDLVPIPDAAASPKEKEDAQERFANAPQAEIEVECSKRPELQLMYSAFMDSSICAATWVDAPIKDTDKLQAPEKTGDPTENAANPAAPKPVNAVEVSRRLLCKDFDSAKSRLQEHLVKAPREKLISDESKRVQLADINGDGRISFKDFARFNGYQIGYNSGRYYSRSGGGIPIGEFMSFVSDAADMDYMLLGPAITPRLMLTVQNERGKQDEIVGSCQMSVSSVLSGSGVGKQQWVTLTHTEPSGDKGKDVTVRAGTLQVELGFRKQAEIDAEREAEEKRKTVKFANSLPSTPRILSSASSASSSNLEKLSDPEQKRLLEHAIIEKNRLLAQVKEESKRSQDLEAQLLAAQRSAAEEKNRLQDAMERAERAVQQVAAQAAHGQAKDAQAVSPDPVLLRKLEELEEFKRRAEIEEAKRKSTAGSEVKPNPQTSNSGKVAAELEMQKQQIADLLKEKKAMEERLASMAKVAATATAVQAPVTTPQTPTHTLSPVSAPSKESKDSKTEPLTLSGSNFTGSKGPRIPVRPASAAPSSQSDRPSAPTVRSPPAEAWVDWNIEPLPAGWDRKKDVNTGRVSALCFLSLHATRFLTFPLHQL